MDKSQKDQGSLKEQLSKHNKKNSINVRRKKKTQESAGPLLNVKRKLPFCFRFHLKR